MEIDNLIIGVRAANVLKANGIYTVSDLAEKLNCREIGHHGMLGKEGWREIALALAYELNRWKTAQVLREPQAGEAVGPRLDAPVVVLAPKLATSRRANSLQYKQTDTSGIELECCATCRYWYEDPVDVDDDWPTSYEALRNAGELYGDCRCRAPRRGDGTPPPYYGSTYGHWPETLGIEWCGDYSLREALSATTVD